MDHPKIRLALAPEVVIKWIVWGDNKPAFHCGRRLSLMLRQFWRRARAVGCDVSNPFGADPGAWCLWPASIKVEQPNLLAQDYNKKSQLFYISWHFIGLTPSKNNCKKVCFLMMHCSVYVCLAYPRDRCFDSISAWNHAS